MEVCLDHLPSHPPRMDHFCIARLMEAAFDRKGHLCRRDQRFVDGRMDPHADMDLLSVLDCIYHRAGRDLLSVVGCTDLLSHRNHFKRV